MSGHRAVMSSNWSCLAGTNADSRMPLLVETWRVTWKSSAKQVGMSNPK